MFSSKTDTFSCQHLPDLPIYHHLTELNLSNLRLTKIDFFPFEYFPNIRSLDLSSNQLIFINPDWSISFENSIAYLNLSENKLETLLFLKDFKHLKILNITGNQLRNNERFLSLNICPTIEHLIDFNKEQIHDDQFKLQQLFRSIDCLKLEQSDEDRRVMIEMIEKQEIFSQFHLSPLGNHFLEKRINQSHSEFQTLTENFDRSMTIQENSQSLFQPIKFLRAHHQSPGDLMTTSVHMCAFESNTSNPILATCGGQKVCFIDCDTCEITHLFEVSVLHPATMPANRKIKDKNKTTTTKEYFSCLCWMKIEDLKILAVGATNGHIYLLSPTHKLMFGHIELSASSISCLTWHSSNPFTLVLGSYHTVRLINIRSYIDRLQSFLRKQNKPSAQFDYVDSSMFINKVSTTHIYNLYDGDGPLILITDLLFYQSAKDNSALLLLVGTTSGLFVINNQEQSPIQLAFPKFIWTRSEYIESLRLINPSSPLIAMNILHLDQIYCFDLEQSLQNQQLCILFTLPNPSRQLPTKIALFSHDNINDAFECLIGSHHGSFHYHQIQSSSTKQLEISWPQTDTSHPAGILSASLNEQYLCFTTNNNLICIYKRQ